MKAVRELPIVLNARTDVYLLEIGAPEKRYEEALRRLTAFRDAGADCVFVPGLRDPATIARLVKDLQCPVNILGGPELLPYLSCRSWAWPGSAWVRARCGQRWVCCVVWRKSSRVREPMTRWQAPSPTRK